MKTTAILFKAEKATISSVENQKGIENHKITAAHLEAAAKHRLEAAEHHEAGDHEKAALSIFTAQRHLSLATEVQREDVKYYALS